MIPLGHQNSTVVPGYHQCIDRETSLMQRGCGIGINALIGISLRFIDLVIIHLFQVCLNYLTLRILPMYIVFVRWITGPPSTWCIYLYDDQPVAIKSGWEYIINLSGGIVTTTNLDIYIVRSNELRRVFFIRGYPRDSKLGIRLRRNGERSLCGQIKGKWWAFKNSFPLTDTCPGAPVGRDINFTERMIRPNSWPFVSKDHFFPAAKRRDWKWIKSQPASWGVTSRMSSSVRSSFG